LTNQDLGDIQQKMTAVFTVGDVVQLVRLEKNPSLNGPIGTVMGVNDSKSSIIYAVQLQMPAGAVVAHPYSISLSPSNLI
jgi:hypothetical protein